MAVGETNQFVSQRGFYPNGINQTITVVYQFDEFDFNPSNDVINFKLNSTLEYTDFKIETDDNIISSVSNLANYDGVDLLSNNTAYNFTFNAFANLCAGCNLNATLGWQLWNHNESEMISEYYEFTENFPKFSFYKSFKKGGYSPPCFFFSVRTSLPIARSRGVVFRSPIVRANKKKVKKP